MSKLDPKTLFEGIELEGSSSSNLPRIPGYFGSYEASDIGGVTKPCIELEVVDDTPRFQEDPKKSKQENNELRDAYYLRRGEARGKIWQAMFICSQSPTGRRLLERAKCEGCKIHISYQYDENQKNGGLYHPKDKTVNLNTNESIEWLTRSLGHELVHRQHEENNLFENENAYLPMHKIARRQALEADAKAHEAQIAYELFVGDKELGLSNAPDNLLKFPEIWEEFRRVEPVIAEAYFSEASSGGAINGIGMRKAHEAFYNDKYNIEFQQTNTVDAILDLARKSPKYIQNKDIFFKETSNSEIRAALTWNGEPYIETEDFTDELHSGLFLDNAAKIRSVQEIRRQIYPENPSAPFILAEPTWDIKTRDFIVDGNIGKNKLPNDSKMPQIAPVSHSHNNANSPLNNERDITIKYLEKLLGTIKRQRVQGAEIHPNSQVNPLVTIASNVRTDDMRLGKGPRNTVKFFN